MQQGNYGGGGGQEDDGYGYGGYGGNNMSGSGYEGGRNLPHMPTARPLVNPEAEGIVDPNQYPEPKEATNKIRGKSDFIEYLFGAVDQELLTVKTFYFFFYSAFGSLFPLMGVYFKQMGMNAGQCGLLIGLRPFIEFLSAPFWGSIADRMQKGKTILLASLSCWIIFTLPLGFIQPAATSCMIRRNHTNYLEIPDPDQRIVKRSTDFSHAHGGARFYTSRFTNDENLEVAANVVFERQRRDDDKAIDVEEIAKNNRPDDVLEYKRFLLNEATEKWKTPKKAYSRNKSPQKPVPSKVLVKRGVANRKLLFNENGQERPEEQEENYEYEEQQQENEDEEEEENVQQRSSLRPREKRGNEGATGGKRTTFQHTQYYSHPSVGQSPLSVSYAENYNPAVHKNWVKPIFSSIVYKLPDIQKAFFLLLLLVIVGEFFAAPAITLADSAVLTLLGEDADRYGHQRMFGSLGWGLAMFFVGIALDHSTAFPDHPCGPDPREKNYTICFAIFSVLMGAALITATQINFKYNNVVPEPEEAKPAAEPTREEQLQSQLSQQLNLPGLQDSSAPIAPKPVPPEGKTKMFAQTTREIPEWVTVVTQFKDVKCASFLFVAWFMGFGIGLIFTFLFWHLQDYGGSPTLFGVASVINHISEIFAYFFSFKLIRQMGHVKVLCLGLGGNVLRFLYISWLRNPWWVLPFEFMQGITHAAVWAACCSYIAHNTPPQLRSSAQGVLQGLHHGLGRGCGAVIGGMFIACYGTTATFRAYGLLCLVVLGAFVFINFYRKDTGFVSNIPQTEDPHQVAEVTHLAPHGVPSIPRALSSSRLHEMANQDGTGYGATYQTSGGNLNIPGAAPTNPNNPFLNTGIGGGGGGGNYTNYNNYHFSNKDAEDEFIRRSFQIYSEVVGKEYDLKPPPVQTHLHAQQPCTNPFHQHDYDW